MVTKFSSAVFTALLVRRTGAALCAGLLAAGFADVAVITVAGAASAGHTNSPPRIGLVLSGGGARGAAHIGVLQVLETLRIPLSCIVGTSMGSIVGGAYAAGAPIESLQAMVNKVNLNSIVNEKPAREDRTILHKLDDQSSLITPELGWRDGELLLPGGVISGVGLEGILRELAPIREPIDFDKLPIPFRAIATDLVTGDMVVLDQGQLHIAMRASMSIPGLVAPVAIGEKLLVDGGLTRNLPVKIARELCADIVIAVNVGTPIAGRDQLNSVVDFSDQVINILTEQNVNRSKAQLRTQDILIEPLLDGIGSGDFNDLAKIVPRGATATRLLATALAKYSISEEAFQTHRSKQIVSAELTSSLPIKRVRVHGLKLVHPDSVLAVMNTRAGDLADSDQLNSDMAKILDQADFSRSDYRLTGEDGQQYLDVYPVEKSWGPNYLQLGLKLSTDFQGDAAFTLLTRYRRTWLNRAGGQWQTDFHFGRDSLLRTQWYQPFSAGSDYFVLSGLEFRNALVDTFNGRQRIGRISVDQTAIGVYAGRQLGKSGVVSFGLVRGTAKPSVEIGAADLVSTGRVETAGMRARLSIDTLDSLSFPTDGSSAELDLFASSEGLGADDRYTRWDLSIIHAERFGANSAVVHFVAGGALRGELPVYESMSLGGFSRLPGLRQGQYLGADLVLLRLAVTRRLPSSSVTGPLYVGASLETGRMRKPFVGGIPSGFVAGGSLFVGTDTLLGPLYLAIGVAEGNNRAAYLFLGNP